MKQNDFAWKVLKQMEAIHGNDGAIMASSPQLNVIYRNILRNYLNDNKLKNTLDVFDEMLLSKVVKIDSLTFCLVLSALLKRDMVDQ
eukprot:Pgem_evm1s5975